MWTRGLRSPPHAHMVGFSFHQHTPLGVRRHRSANTALPYSARCSAPAPVLRHPVVLRGWGFNMLDQRSAASAEYRKLYKTARWRKTRDTQLSLQPLCERCLAMGIVEEATVVHHGDGGHKGDVEKFWFGPFESLCAPHHNSEGQREDLGQTIATFGPDGWPVG